MTNKIRLGINGLGRIGRQIYKLCIDDTTIDLVGINEINPDINNWIYTLNYDSIYGKGNHTTTKEGKYLICNSNKINTSHFSDINQVPWDKWGVDFIID